MSNDEPRATPICQQWLKTKSGQRILYQLEQNLASNDLFMVVTFHDGVRWASQRHTLSNSMSLVSSMLFLNQGQRILIASACGEV
jgi:hypothetical protein